MASHNHTHIGTIAKTHGVRGELIIRTADPSIDLKEYWESIFLMIEGIPVPFFISSLRSFKAGEWAVSFDWYGDKDQAEKLVGHEVWVGSRLPDMQEKELYFDELVGYEFKDILSGREGIITGFMDIAENPLFEAESEGARFLIPAREEFITRYDPQMKTVSFRLPEGLI